MMKWPTRLERERRTLQVMIQQHCRRHHGMPLCLDCTALLAYAQARLLSCPYQQSKPTCGACPIHCYQPQMRERIRTLMRQEGPRMLFHHPLLALAHLLDGFRRSRPLP